jgi:nicotinate dehydrogenase subunit B
VDDSAARKVSGFVETMRKGDFVAVVAQNEWAAVKAMRAMKVTWSPGTGLPDQSTVFDMWRKSPSGKNEATQKVGDTTAALAGAARRIKASYDLAIQTHASIGPSCAVADYKDGKLTVWTGSQGPHTMQHEIAPIVGLAMESIRVLFLDAPGCYGRNGAEDASADAALIATLIGKPVRVQHMRDDETARSPKSPPGAFDLEAGFDAQGNVVAWLGDFYIQQNHMAAFKPIDFPLHAAMEVGLKKPGNWVGFLWQNATVPYAFPNILVNTHHIAEPVFRSAHLRTPGRLENGFANESFVDEIATVLKVDPAEFRLKGLSGKRPEPPHEPDVRALEVIRETLKLAGWESRSSPNPNAGSGPFVKGRGMAYARYNHRITYVAAVAEVEVNRQSGEIRVTRISLGHDCGQIVNPDGVKNQIEGGVIQTVSRVLMEQVKWDRTKVTTVDWASYPIIRFPDVPRVDVVLIDRPREAPWAAGEPMAVVIPGAIGNAVFDATGVRLRSVPFTPEKVKAALATAEGRKT